MSTRSHIIVELPCGKFGRAYAHWGGHPRERGPLLLKHYNTARAARRLIAAGDMSVVDKKTSKPQGHSFSTPKDGYCVYYGRDRGETETEMKVFQNLPSAYSEPEGWEEYVYVWIADQWFVGDPDGGLDTLKPLIEVVQGVHVIKSFIKAPGLILGQHTT